MKSCEYNGKDKPTKSNKNNVNSVLINSGVSKTINPLNTFSTKFDL